MAHLSYNIENEVICEQVRSQLLRTIYCILVTCMLLMPAFSLAGDAAAGKNKIENCVACHGTTGVSENPLWPNIAGQGEGYLIKQIHDIKEGRRAAPTMLSFVQGLSDDDIADIAAWYASQPPVITGARPFTNEEYNLSSDAFLALGERLYRYGNKKREIPACSICHSPTGQGNVLAKYPLIGGQHYDYLVTQLNYFANQLRKNDGEEQSMRLSVQNLRKIEIEAVANYIAGLKQ